MYHSEVASSQTGSRSSVPGEVAARRADVHGKAFWRAVVRVGY
jgi:hypothetical protein